MAETKSPHEPAMPPKRKPDLTSQYQENLPLKSPKLQTLNETSQAKEGNHSPDNHTLDHYGNDDSSVPEPRPDNEEPRIDAEEEDDDYEEEDDDSDDNEEEEENGNAAVDWKGKGILMEEEKDSDEDDDDSTDGGNTEGESDLSDDPLAEVDLDNILPSRTRQLVVQPGIYIAKDVGNNGEGDDSNSSDG